MLYDTYLNQSQIPPRYREEIQLRPEPEDLEAYETLDQIRQNIFLWVKQGQNLLLCSPYVGNGKTTWATKLLKAYLHEVEQFYFEEAPALFINVTCFLNEKRLAISDPTRLSKVNELERQILNAKVVVFDDLGVKDLSAYDANNLYYWIDYRTVSQKSCIFTSNLLPAQLFTLLDPRLYDRVVNYSQVVVFNGGSQRSPVVSSSIK